MIQKEKRGFGTRLVVTVVIALAAAAVVIIVFVAVTIIYIYAENSICRHYCLHVCLILIFLLKIPIIRISTGRGEVH